MSDRFTGYYTLLALKPGAGWRELKAAYRSRIRTCHPDRFQEDARRKIAEEQTKALNRAYEELVRHYREHGRLPYEFISDPAPERNVAAPPSHGADSAPYSPAPIVEPNVRPGTVPWAVFGGLLALAVVSTQILLPTAPEDSTQPLAPPTTVPATTTTPALSRSAATDTNQNTFTLGSTMSQVYAAQGVPSRTDKDVWFYGTSKIYFADGNVARWEETPGYPLKTHLDPNAVASRRTATFGAGSTKFNVRNAQGNPTRESEKTWHYGLSSVYFQDDKVVGWQESPFDPLKLNR